MITYTFTNTGSDSLYEYLYKCIKNDILQGNLRAGEKLPSKRTFAKNLGISVITVENAYRAADRGRLHLFHSEKRILCDGSEERGRDGKENRHKGNGADHRR